MEHKILVVLCLILIFEQIQGSSHEKECPEGSQVNSKGLCVCKESFYRLDVFNYSSMCFKDNCPPEARKVVNIIFPSMKPTCICDVRTNHWGNNSDNCIVKEGGCPNKDLVRETGKCGCSSGHKYDAGECKPALKPTTLPELKPTSPAMKPTTSPGGNNTGSMGNEPSSGKVASIVGGCIGGILFAALIGCLIYFFWKRRKAQKDNINAMELGVGDPLVPSGVDNNQGVGVNPVPPNSGQNGNSGGSNPDPEDLRPGTPSSEQNQNPEGSNPDPEDLRPGTPSSEQNQNPEGSNPDPGYLNPGTPSSEQNRNPEGSNPDPGDLNPGTPSSEQNRNPEGSNPDPGDLNPGTPSSEQNRNPEGSNPEPQDSNPSNGQDGFARPNGVTVNYYYGPVMFSCSDIQNGENNRKTVSKTTNKMRHDV